MTPLLAQFVSEARDVLQGVGDQLLALEREPGDAAGVAELFRLVHTLKGNAGLFDFPEMTRVLHAGEDLMDAVRDGRAAFSPALADRLLAAADFVAALVDEVEEQGGVRPGHAGPAEELAQALRSGIPAAPGAPEPESGPAAGSAPAAPAGDWPDLGEVPEPERLAAWRRIRDGGSLFLAVYRPEPECFYKGEDPFLRARRVPGLVWGRMRAAGPWPAPAELDCYACRLVFEVLSEASREELDEHFRYVPEQVELRPVPPLALAVPQGGGEPDPVAGDFVEEGLRLLEAEDRAGFQGAVQAMLELSAPHLWFASALRWLDAMLEGGPRAAPVPVLRHLVQAIPAGTGPDWRALEVPAAAGPDPEAGAAGPVRERILAAQEAILALPGRDPGLAGRLRACATVLGTCLGHPASLAAAAEAAVAAGDPEPLREWLGSFRAASAPGAGGPGPAPAAPAGTASGETRAGKVLKVDQGRVDRLMDLIGEMVVAKNGLPYLAARAETRFGVRELAREIKAQYAVINRIAEEMQEAIMQVRMMPVATVLQRFPRLVRDLSRRLGKEVDLVLEGEGTEADKTILEALADPLLHLVRNSLDHGLEQPEERLRAGKPRAGRLTIRASQESDHVLLEVADDGRGMDPGRIRRKALEKGLAEAERLGRMSDQEIIELVFQPGFSTAETVSDLSGRGVGMDVVRHALDRVGGSVALASEPGRGTTVRLSLPLSLAVTNVMIVESDGQAFGIPMDTVVETVRLAPSAIHQVKHQAATVLRRRIVPLLELNRLLGIPAGPRPTADGELAALVVRRGGQRVGLLVDRFCGVVDVILKPLGGALADLACYAGTALLGDGSVLMVLDPKELIR